MRLGLLVNLVLIVGIVIMVGLLTEQKPECYTIPEENVEEARQNATHEITEERISYVAASIEETKDFWFFSSGNSMTPTIKDGMACHCEKTDSYLVGDIVNFPVDYNGELLFVSHRIVGYELDNTFITKGDNNPIADPWKLQKDSILCEIQQKSLLQTAIERILQ